MDISTPAVFSAVPNEDGIRVVRVNNTPATLDPNIFKGIGRNDVCPCGSGKKFKHCHGK
ncbi:MAG: SEC-C metal-binding domain-containing protein [Candidatus Gracilibacteria bacterium]|nr:SEC-C metal-binding domain-containing protein [Candidatus Gracilibacteria bacterium]